MKKVISISLFVIIAMVANTNTADAQRMIRGGVPVMVSPVGATHCRVRVHRGWRHHRAVIVGRPIAVRPIRMHRNRW